MNSDPLRSLLVEKLAMIARVKSSTSNVEGVNQVQHILARQLKDLGFDIHMHPSPSANFGSLLEARRPSRYSTLPFLTLVGHADTVFEPTAENPVYHDPLADRLFGPGVLDDKAGLVVGLEALRIFLSQNPKTPLSFRLISSPNEEAGSVGFHELLKKWGKESLAILGLEPAYSDGSIISSRRGNRWYNILIEGHPAHTGRSTGRDLNAAEEAAVKITKLLKLNHFKKQIRVSVGSLRGGGDLYNVICGEVRVLLDTRFPDFRSSGKLDLKIKKILKKSYLESRKGNLSAHTSFEIADDCPAFSSSRGSRKLAQKLQTHLERLEGCVPGIRHGGGASDVNYLAHPRAIMLDGLGAVGDGMHAKNEWVSVTSITTRAHALTRLFKDCEKL